MGREHGIQNAIRNALVDQGLFFRANVGQGWTGEKVTRCDRHGTVRVAPGDIVIRAGRPFSTGLPNGFADLFGMVPTVVTEQHVGQKVARFAAIEVKTEDGRASKQQNAFLQAVQRNGGLSGVARSPAGALAILRGSGA